MAFILHLIDAPEVTTVKAAELFLAGAGGGSSAPNPRFGKFAEAIAARCRETSDGDPGDDDNLWEDGLPAAEMTGNRYELVLKDEAADAALVREIAGAAAEAGIHVFDGEGMVLYRADRRVVDMSGREQRL